MRIRSTLIYWPLFAPKIATQATGQPGEEFASLGTVRRIIYGFNRDVRYWHKADIRRPIPSVILTSYDALHSL